MSEYALEIVGLKKVYDNNVEALKGIDLKINNLSGFLKEINILKAA